MIKASLIYTAVTILLALVDAYRIKKAKGVVENINHEVSASYAIYGGAITLVIWTVLSYKPGEWHWNYLIKVLILSISFIGIRLAIYSIFLNLIRRLPINYVSIQTNNKSDIWLRNIPFWGQRFLGIVVYVGTLIIFNICQLN